MQEKIKELNDEELEQINGGTTVLVLGACNQMKSGFGNCSDYDSSSEACQTCSLRPNRWK